MPLYEYECDACGERFEVIRKFSDPARRRLHRVRKRSRAAAAVVAGDSVQGHRLVHHRLRAEGEEREDRLAPPTPRLPRGRATLRRRQKAPAKGEAAGKGDTPAKTASSTATSGSKD